MKVHTRLAHNRVDHSKLNTTYLVVTLEAPSLDWVKKRPSVAILPVLDLSGSMRGSKLAYAKKSILKLIEHLQPGDFIGLVTFSDGSRVDVEPGEATPEQKDRMRRTLERLDVEGGTNLADALVDSIGAIQALDLPLHYLHRVILFTDGQPTVGVTDTDAILRLTQNKLCRASVSAFGYGDVGGGVWNGCDQEFLGNLATLGGGNYAYVQDPDDALSAFGKELGGLLSTYATGIRVEVEPVAGHVIKNVVTDTPYVQDPTGAIDLPVPNLLSEEIRHFVLEVELNKQKSAFPRDTTVFDVRADFLVMTEDGDKEVQKQTCKAKVRFVKPGEEQTEPDKEVDKIVALAQMVRTQLEAEKKADAGDHQGAADVLKIFGQQLQNRGYEGMARVTENLGNLVVNPVMYQANAGYRRSVARGATRAYSVSSMDSDAALHLADCQVSMSNSAMVGTVQSFTSPEAPASDLESPQAPPLEENLYARVDPDHSTSGPEFPPIATPVWTTNK